MQGLGKPWHRRRALRVFRDDASLSASPALWPSIENALAQSRYLILLASPEAAASPWVAKEVKYWLDHKSADTLLIALTDGELGWDNAAGDFTRRDGAPLPAALAGRFSSEPKWVDLRAYRAGASTSDARFTELAADFAAAIHGMPKDDLLSQEVRQQRRALSLAWGAVGLLLMFAVLAGWQWNVSLRNERAAVEQQRIAQQQRDRAERALAVATETANSLVFDLAWEFRDRVGMPKDLASRILNRAQELQKRLAESGETGPGLRRSEAMALSNLSLTLLALDDTTAALAAAQRAGAIMEALTAIDPGNAMWQRDLSINHNRIAEALEAAGRREEAMEQYRRGLAMAAKLAAADPGNTLLQDDLSVSHGRVGRLLAAAGQRDGALAEYRKSLAIIERLAAADPANTHWQRAMSVMHGHIGSLLRAVERHEEALAQYRNGLAIAEKLAALDSSNTQWQRDLSIAYSRIGEVLHAAGRRDDAVATYRRGLAIHEKLVAGDSRNIQWQRDLLIVHGQIGDALAAAGQREGALAQYRQSIVVAERLASANPGDATSRREAWTAHIKIGDLLRTAAERDGALVEYRRSLAIAQELAAIDPGNVTWQLDLVTSLYQVSTFLEAAEARPLLHRALAILDPLAQANRLAAAQSDWPQLFRRMLAILPAE